MMKNISFKTRFALVLAIVLWASAFVGIRAGLQGYTPGSLGLLRFIVASICMGFIYFKFGKRDHIILKDKLSLLLIGVVGIGCYNIALNYGEVSVSSGISSFIISQSPIISSIFAAIYLSERLTMINAIGMTISLLGVFLISIGQTKGLHFDIGIFYVLIATFVGALYSIMQKPLLKKYHAIDVTAYILWGGTLMLLIFTPELIRDVHTTSLSATLATIYLGIFPASVAYIAWSYALVEMPASRAVSFLYFMPIVATLLGWLWLGEVPAVISLIGGLIALLGVWVFNQTYTARKLKTEVA